MDWTNFYLAAAAAAATLIGLLFIAVQFNIDVFALDPGNRWRAISRSTFGVYGTLFFLPMIMLLPGLPTAARAEAMLVVAGFGIVRVVAAATPVLRGVFGRRAERAWQTGWVLVAPSIAYLALMRAAFEVWQGDVTAATQQLTGFIILGLFAIALRNSWNLLVDGTYELRHKGRHQG